MEANLQANLAFYLTGKQQPEQLDEIGKLKLRPALFAGYRDLTRLRYDFPLVLIDATDGRCVESLCALVDGILDKVAKGADGERIRKNVLRLEQEIRVLVEKGNDGRIRRFSELWDEAAAPLAKKDKLFADSLVRARANLKTDGEVIGCNAQSADRLLGHAWSLTQRQRASHFNTDLKRVLLKLSDILQADYINSDEGKTAENLKHAFGSGPLDSFNFDAMSKILKKVRVHDNLPKRRRQRILKLIDELQAQRFFPVDDHDDSLKTSAPYSFAFDSCADALKAYRERLPEAIALAKAIAIAELEISGEYSEARHDALFESFGENGLDAEELAIFPDYLVRLNATALSGPEQSTLTEVLSADLPFKILVQTDDILEKSPIEKSHLTFLLRSKQLARMAMGMGIFVLQCPAASLYTLRQAMQRGLNYGGTALFSVFSGDSPNTTGNNVTPYLVGAAACESRLFPAFCFNPAAGRNWAARFSFADNAQLDQDWPQHELVYQDERYQSIRQTTPFTLADFVSLDARYSRHFARVPKAKWNDQLVPAAEVIASESRGQIETVPYLMMVDANNTLQKVIVDERIIREARRCRLMWNSLQELGGIHNSHAERLLAEARQAWEASVVSPANAQAPAPDAAATASVDTAAAKAETERAPDEAYIETARCSTCNECIQFNGKMFAYDANQQAYIADINAGTYAQLVEAAENCQVAIIHPGKPRNPNEPGLDDLLKRAEAFA